jgi:hypothetical protein
LNEADGLEAGEDDRNNEFEYAERWFSSDNEESDEDEW